MAELACRRVGADMHAVQKHLPVFDPRITVAQIGPMTAQRFNLGAGQRHPGLERFLDKEVVPRLAVIDDEIVAVGGRPLGFFARHLWIESIGGTCGQTIGSPVTQNQPCRNSPATKCSPTVRATFTVAQPSSATYGGVPITGGGQRWSIGKPGVGYG